MAINTVIVTQQPNTVALTKQTTVVQPLTLDHTVTVGNTVQTLEVSTQDVTLTLIQTPVAVSVQPATISVVTGGVQGPQGPAGVDSTSDNIIVLNKSERRDTLEDTPSLGDITIYYGIAAPQTLNSAAAWLITRTIFLADGEAFDSTKTFASASEDQIWDNRLGLTYS